MKDYNKNKKLSYRKYGNAKVIWMTNAQKFLADGFKWIH